MLNNINIKGRTITADALLTQRNFATYLVKQRQADYHFTVKANQKTLLNDITLHFNSKIDRDSNNEITAKPDFTQTGTGEHGRIETRKIWITTKLNDYLKFPHVGQVFMIQRESINKKSGKTSKEVIYGITSCSIFNKSAEQVLLDNQRHWKVESMHYTIDWNYDEDRSVIRTGYAPENITRLRRFVIGLMEHKKRKAKSDQTFSEMMKRFSFNVRSVLDCLKMTGCRNYVSTA